MLLCQAAKITLQEQAGNSGSSAAITATHSLYSGGDIPGGLDNRIASFSLAAGYMAVVACLI